MSDSPNLFYYQYDTVDGLRILQTAVGITALVTPDGVVAMSYNNLLPEMEPVGQVQTLSAQEAMETILQLSADYLEMFGIRRLQIVDAELVYDALRVIGHDDKAILSPVWEFTDRSGTLFWVDAIYGDFYDGNYLPCATIEQWEGR